MEIFHLFPCSSRKMNNDKQKLSLAARYIKRTMCTKKGPTVGTCKFVSVINLIPSLLYFSIGIKDKDATDFVLAVVWLGVAFIWFMKAGFVELIEKEYTKKDRTSSSTLR